MSKLPSTWIDVEIGEIAEVIGGGTPKANDVENFTAPGEGIAWLTPADLSGYKRKEIAFGARDLTLQGYKSCSAKLMPKGSLLFSSRAPIGYVAVAANEIATNQGFKSFVLSHDIDPSYAFYYLKSIRQLADSLGTGTTFKEISGATAKTLPFRLAPTVEQTRIAAKLDELLAKVDTLKARIDGIPALLKRFRHSVFAVAVSGHLTEKWRLSLNTSKPLASWKNCKIGDISSLVTSGSRGWADYYSDSGAIFIRSQDINTDELEISDTAFVKLPDSSEGKRTRVQYQDILLTITGANVGKVARVKQQIPEAYVSQHVALVRLYKPEYAPFIELFLKDIGSGRGILLDLAYGGGKPGLNLSNIRDLLLPLPPIDEQIEIIRRVEQLFAFADQLEAKVTKAQSRIDLLTQSILAKAFRGKLVPQDLNDEPASVLLERIKAKRAVPPKVKRRSKSS
ncbi:restriction endonuclease subunit S [Pseudomonas sp. 58(2021)]|uniref:restriction endonuclease subunit S n=1 Tax=Pseudomonas sp. 58(2021) TaxID=2813330 RepID=UPI001A9EF0B4|nr:restriction endonuclease subunit S [Pseudomonas sp. 58(2021)]